MLRLRSLPKQLFIYSMLFIGFGHVSANAQAELNEKITIPVVDGARIFAQFDDSTPAVINYFTLAKEQEVIVFYSEKYGQPSTQERKRGRLTLNYASENQQIRVVISQQNKYRQVDVIVDQAPIKK